MANETVRFETTIQKKVALDYLLHLPGSYDDDPGLFEWFLEHRNDRFAL